MDEAIFSFSFPPFPASPLISEPWPPFLNKTTLAVDCVFPGINDSLASLLGLQQPVELLPSVKICSRIKAAEEASFKASSQQSTLADVC